ncbi:hypothetical protein HHL16_00955 [Pseudoflavitalea sp. G-6-1-2]|uniref:metallophosphoesterase n=1 Tax=Pseudoflavitalea sp. G-6-1-2 TaxID=2728841 RepID=UPI00146EF1F0|nr:metallophosphoesterase [Pseudoflavitalea sp. G-6-1-2]NML19416.1 hypothetical protein [Pseudoflavitalea sp. G-6-1-2]
MRIVQLSDIHLSKENLVDLRSFYIESLVDDLKKFHEKSPIDIIIFSGDLLDKGGASLGDNPYTVFNNEIIAPITSALNISHDHILFLAGNHDVNRQQIDKRIEFYLAKNLTRESANEELIGMREEFTNTNSRIRQFKEFEKEFHEKNTNYKFSNNESVTIVRVGNLKFGIALINDSWRCSSELKQEEHFIGSNQLFNAKRYFNSNQTDMNIAVFHHPLDAINPAEREEVENILKSQNFDVAFFGHSHRYHADSIWSASGGYLALNGRSAFSQANETSSLFQPGYCILDLNVQEKLFSIHARKFIKNSGFRFDKDTDSLPDGKYDGKLPNKIEYYKLAEVSNNEDKSLPNSYTADVHRIVSLLIGKSIYPNPYVFVRELIQNSVDACNRVRVKQTHSNPKIIIRLNMTENYFEVEDEGDGMSKEIIKNHFSVIGKSISQEFNDSTGNFNLISRFGIGFISTFIAAEKVIVSTKSDEDDQVIFEIQDVFKGFNYITPSESNKKNISGTTIRVYLKREFTVQMAFQHAQSYCRHISNLEIYINGARFQSNESWNTDGCVFEYSDVNDKYELRLGISGNARTIIASNSGFLISHLSHTILPFRFPQIICGEVNFKPKAIDFDVSRSNVIASPKSEAFRKEISIALRKLFRLVLESDAIEIKRAVMNYLHYYLQYYDTNYVQVEQSYSDFYSKKELLSLCSEYTLVKYHGMPVSFLRVIQEIKKLNITNVYINSKFVSSEYELIVSQYLEDMGNLVIENNTINVQFWDGSQPVSLSSVLQLLCSEHGMVLTEISEVNGYLIDDMKMDKNQFPDQLRRHISLIESRLGISIEVGKFNKTTKPSVNNGSQYFLNFGHETFDSLISKEENIQDDLFQIYLLGLLGLKMDYQ